ncbi:DNA cytosine methyltransferase [Mycoplasmopsis felis]|uniref:DNA cytosine methyltransferase n=1 Tax=Mycoplasmopsis felis TaxID=33923 RepID=UPI0021AF6BFD|nr:DNA cytosine methyltransferase [Mycoplasmopsis felis]MCU9931689.1 DNA cytosine methyltransferase [Mycoplasmopsis felis]UWV78169.1 DNA cytosine methyltransferase [Mycoplasmopsis felis]UWV84099.1 DNA cytosine methyltransferase [Mycoplasmopsis felis]UWW00702.1 DNA cytosine methyltransferase [Mycoplasmopsis felis]WAM02639.1 DNA cytosine methyltransferase [Mycoplasmopsis felis]
MKRKMIDLFAGAGGLTYGFWKEGFDIVETIEFWKPATETYNYNFKTNIIPLDITNQETKDNLYNDWTNKIDLIIGGFPCQGFSMAGKRSQEDDRNKLYLHTVDIIKNIKPEVFVLENVKGILSYKEYDGIKVTDKIIELLNKSGYYCKFILLDCSKFGIPQKRERVIFIGTKKKNKDKVDKTIKMLDNYNEKVMNVYEAIFDLKDAPENIDFNHIFTKHKNDFIEKIKNTPVGKSPMKNYSDAFRRIDYYKPSPTVKENHGGVHIHPELHRVLTPRELARLQSFPDEFIFLGTKSNILKQIGNAVPPKLSEVIAKMIKEIFF